MLERLRDGHHARASRCIPNGVDTSRFVPNHAMRSESPQPVFGWAGRIVDGKGIEVLLRAASSIRGRPFRIRLAGDGPLRAELEGLADAVGIGHMVSFEGHVLDMPDFWAGCDIAVSPATVAESFGVAPVEASASGLPVIASASGALAEVVQDGVTGTLVPPDDVDALRRAMEAYLDSGELRARHGAAGRERAILYYSLDRCLDEYLSLFPA
jgi:glycosyltransferase involved in cell wall biosynthesis